MPNRQPIIFHIPYQNNSPIGVLVFARACVSPGHLTPWHLVLIAPPGGFLFLSKKRIKKMVSYDPNYEGVIQNCKSCGKEMSSFQSGTDELKSSEDPTRGMCADCAIPDERERFGSEVLERNLAACGYPSVSDEYDDIPENAGVSPDYIRVPDDYDPEYPPGDVRNIDFDSCDYRPSWDETYDEFDDEY